MSIRTLPFDEIDETHIVSLKDRAIAEDRTLDYKRELSFDQDGKVELLKDVTAMANSAGGTILYGVEEGEGDQRGQIVAFSGIQGIAADDVHNRIDQLLHDGIDERIPGVLHRAVPRGDGGFYYVVRVPPSHLAPHMVNVTTKRPRFYYRGTTTNQPMDARQIREVALRAESAIDRATQLMDERIAALKEESRRREPIETNFGRVRDGPDQVVLHIIPLFPSIEPHEFTDSSVVVKLQSVLPLWASGGHGVNARYSLEGVYSEVPGAPWMHVLFLRKGGIELQAYEVLERTSGEKSVLVFHPGELETRVRRAVDDALRLSDGGLLSLPALVRLALLDVKHSHLLTSRKVLRHVREPLPIDDVIIDPWLLRERGESVERELTRMFDIMWQAWGWDKSHTSRR